MEVNSWTISLLRLLDDPEERFGSDKEVMDADGSSGDISLVIIWVVQEEDPADPSAVTGTHVPEIGEAGEAQGHGL